MIKQGGDDLRALVLASQAKLKAVAPKWFSVERMIRLAFAARSRSPALAECTGDSFLLFCMRCAETGLEPIGAGGAWPVPFRNKHTGKREVVFIPDWRGLIWLAKKDKAISHAYAYTVHEKDEFTVEYGDAPHVHHVPAVKERGDVIGAYFVANLPNGDKHIEFMTKEELDAIRGRSKAATDGPWVTDTAEMYRKTVVKRGIKPFAGSPQLQTAIDLDNEALGFDLPEQKQLQAPRRASEALPPAQPASTPEPTTPPPDEKSKRPTPPPSFERERLEMDLIDWETEELTKAIVRKELKIKPDIPLADIDDKTVQKYWHEFRKAMGNQ